MKSKQNLKVSLLVLAMLFGLNTFSFVSVSAQVNKNVSQKQIQKDLNLLRQKGFGFLQRKNWSEANIIFEQALAKFPNDYVSLYGNGLALFNLRQIKKADENLIKAIDVITKDQTANQRILVDSYVLSAVISATQKQNSVAIEKLLKAVKIAPKHFDANLTLGRAYFGNGDIANAVKYFQEAVKIKPSNLQARFFLATSLERIGSLQVALEQYREVVKINSNYAEGNLGLGVLLINLEGTDSVEGLNALKKAVELKGNLYEARLTLGKTLVKLNRSAEAIEHLQKAVELAPNNPEPHYQLALAYRKSGKKAEAAEQMKIVKSIHAARRGVSSKN